jgi:hypothetical protein
MKNIREDVICQVKKVKAGMGFAKLVLRKGA